MSSLPVESTTTSAESDERGSRKRSSNKNYADYVTEYEIESTPRKKASRRVEKTPTVAKTKLPDVPISIRKSLGEMAEIIKKSNQRMNIEESNTEEDVDMTKVASGRWTKREHLAFLVGVRKYGKQWKKVSAHIKTRTAVQTRTHAQKYFVKLQSIAASQAAA